ncbi:rRNA maturation RNase YbeY [Candidatus Omnitrophota bacterium]
MRVEIRDLQTKIKIDKKEIARCAKFVLRAMGEHNAELSLLFVKDYYIKELNRKYRKINSRTDVLVFAMREGQGILKDSPILGDVVISVETAKREAKKRKLSIHKETCLYLVHGILHLLGYDDIKKRDRQIMKSKEEELMRFM